MSFLDTIDSEFETQAGKLDALPEGEYLFAFVSAKYKCVDNAKMQAVILEAVVQVCEGEHDGRQVQFDTWVKDGAGAKRLAGDLAKLGFDSAGWTLAAGRPFTGELKKAANCLPGVRFRGKKTTSSSGGKTYHNLNIVKRDATDGRPAAFGPEQLDADPATASFEEPPF